jgi:hypothetical protein
VSSSVSPSFSEEEMLARKLEIWEEVLVMRLEYQEDMVGE